MSSDPAPSMVHADPERGLATGPGGAGGAVLTQDVAEADRESPTTPESERESPVDSAGGASATREAEVTEGAETAEEAEAAQGAASRDEARAEEAGPPRSVRGAPAGALRGEDAQDVPRESLARPPLLASEALMEDLAPVEPARAAARVWCAAVGVGFMLLGGLSVAGLRPGGGAAGAWAFALGAVALIAALTQVPYRRRAVAMVVVGVLAAAIGLRGSGPALGIAAGGVGWGAARFVAAAALPAALVFRSRYRAYAGARWLLVAAFVATLPYLVHGVVALVLRGPHLGQLGAIVVLVAMLASLTGFMGAETTGAGAYVAGAAVLAFTVDLAIVRLVAAGAVTVGSVVDTVTAGLAFAATSALTCLGLFQILAWRLAADARRIDLHTPRDEPKDRHRPSSADWLS